MHSVVIEVRTGARETVHDLTGECAAFLAEVAADEGLLHGSAGHGREHLLPALRPPWPVEGRLRGRLEAWTDPMMPKRLHPGPEAS